MHPCFICTRETDATLHLCDPCQRALVPIWQAGDVASHCPRCGGITALPMDGFRTMFPRQAKELRPNAFVLVVYDGNGCHYCFPENPTKGRAKIWQFNHRKKSRTRPRP